MTEKQGGTGTTAAGPAGDRTSGRSMWSAKPIRDMTADELLAGIAHMQTFTTDDDALLRALTKEFNLRQAGVRPGGAAGGHDGAPRSIGV